MSLKKIEDAGTDLEAHVPAVTGEVLSAVLERTPEELQRIFDSLPPSWQKYVRDWENVSLSIRKTGAVNSLQWVMRDRRNEDSLLLSFNGYGRLQELALDDRFVAFYIDQTDGWIRVCGDTEISGNGDTVIFNRDGEIISAGESEDTSFV